SELRYALRGLLRRPALAIVTIAALTIGISANAVMFGAVNQLMLQPPAYIRDPGSVRRIFIQQHLDGKPTGGTTEPYRLFAALRAAPAFSDVAIYSLSFFTMGHEPDAQLVSGAVVTQNFFRTLGVQPAMGRVFLPEEDRPPRGPLVAILSDGFWHRVFAGARDVIGKTVSLDDKPFTIVGVMPAGFTGVERYPMDVWVPMSAVTAEHVGEDWATTPDSYWVQGVARVRPNETVALAERQATTLYRNEIRSWNHSWQDSTGVITLGSLAAGSAPMGLSPEASVAVWLFGVSTIVLIIACANVANLLIVRTIERRREIAVRMALGASRGQLLRQLLVESALLAGIAAVAALVVAQLGAGLVQRVILPRMSWDGSILDGHVLVFTLLIALLCIFLAGLAPAVQAASTSVNENLKASSRQVAGGRGLLRSALLAMQVSLSLILLIGAGLFVRSLRHVTQRHVGIDIDKVVVVTPTHRRDTPEERLGQWYRAAHDRAMSLPGVERVALVGSTIPGRTATGWSITVPGHKAVEFPGGGPYFTQAGSDYFRTMGTRIVRGRGFTPEEERGPSRVMLVNSIVADAYWPGGNAIGQCVKFSDDKACTTVVGVVENMMLFRLVNDDRASIYVPWTHPEFKNATASGMVVRAHANGEQLAPVLLPAMRTVAPLMPFVSVEPYTQIVAPELRPWRLGATMFSIFGILATIIAAVGLYSVMAYWASQRTHEIGVRMALGARAVDVVRLLARHAGRTVGAGLAVGTVVSFGLARGVADLLYDTSPREPGVYVLAAAALALAAVVAIIVPARRVTGVDPATALRSD
ncbi:MAG TPA: ADOP family duplicated permease, partial [Gemmatimonadaceae bacterium]|nr:ADOP family duplicated permease [Gemmatimonadaceae bacterium]